MELGSPIVKFDDGDFGGTMLFSQPMEFLEAGVSDAAEEKTNMAGSAIATLILILIKLDYILETGIE